MDERPWADQLRALTSAVDRASAGVDVLARQMPEPLGEHLTALYRELNTIHMLAQALLDRLFSGPFEKLVKGWTLSQEEYYLCRAMGVNLDGAHELGLTELADYEVYRMLCYEDDRRFCYINVHLAPLDPELVSLRFGCPPEECHRRHLRPEQLAFFRERLPDIFRRFSDD
jgi:hypothetical protein